MRWKALFKTYKMSYWGQGKAFKVRSCTIFSLLAASSILSYDAILLPFLHNEK
jgi:hypothetical protein